MAGGGKHEAKEWYRQLLDHGGFVGYDKEFGFIQSEVRSHCQVEVGALKQQGKWHDLIDIF